MKLSKLLESAGIAFNGADAEVTNITNDSRRVTEGSLFVCANGRKQQDYGKYIEEAESKGAVAVVTQELRQTESELAQYVADNALEAYAEMSAEFFGHPAKELKLIGITGTNGKTSTAYFTKQILESAGHKTGLIGTVETLAGDEVISTGLTTPEPFDLHGIFARMKEKGIEYVVMECSSQALDQKRLHGIGYAVTGFTNLTQDHLDYHGSFRSYIDAKGIVFTQTHTAVLNADDGEAEGFARIMGSKPVLTYSVTDPSADFYADSIVNSAYMSEFVLCYKNGRYPVKVSTPGKFAVYNALCAVGMAVAAGIPVTQACAGMTAAKSVKGRAEICYRDENITVIIDYAHTPDAVMNILKAVKTDGKKTVLFGCGGDRDSTKRPLMAIMAARYADKLVITSDNPRTEDPMRIIEDILLGLHTVDVPYVTMPDRREAIAYALKNAEKGETIFLLGKGHEDYQILSTGKIHFDEREVVADIMKEIQDR